MADFYCDISAIGNEYEAYADTPTTWGMPQDGNGLAGPGHSAAVAIWTIDCTSAQGDGAQTLSILGVSVSNASSGSGATLAASLVTSINGTSTATTATYCQLLLPLNRLIFARQNPDELAKVQVMMRIAGADWNSDTPTHAGFTTGPSISLTQSGVDGPFAYINYGSTVFGKSASTYGVFNVASPAKYALTYSDNILVRTKRSGTNISLTCNTNFVVPASGRTFIFDDGTTWTGDDGTLTITTSASLFGVQNGARCSLIARKKYGLTVLLTSAGMVRITHYDGSYGGTSLWQNVYAETTNASGYFRMNPDGNSSRAILVGCYLKQNKTGVFSVLSGGSMDFALIDTICEWAGVSSNEPGLFSFASAATAFASVLMLVGCSFIVGGGNYNLALIYSNASLKTAAPTLRVYVENCTGLSSAAIGFTSGHVGTQAFYPITSNLVTRDVWSGSLRSESAASTSDWLSENASSYPTLGTISRYGVPMGYRFSWEGARLPWVQYLPLEVCTLTSMYRDTSAVKACRVEMLVPSAEIPTKGQLGLMVSYTDSLGFKRTETNFVEGLLNTTPLDNGVGTGSWTLNGVTGVSSKKLSITTANAVKANTDVCLKIFMMGVAPSGTHSIYLSPEILFS